MSYYGKNRQEKVRNRKGNARKKATHGTYIRQQSAIIVKKRVEINTIHAFSLHHYLHTYIHTYILTKESRRVFLGGR